MSKKITLIIIIIILVGLGYWFYQSDFSLKEVTAKERACINSGGTVRTSMCCKSSGDFPNLCLVGPCGCSPENSHQIKICDCGPNKCFDGKECLLLDEVLVFLKDLKEGTKIDFSSIQSVDFKWIVETDPQSKEINVTGQGFEATDLSIEKNREVEEFFLEKDFNKDAINVTAGTVAELIGYKKGEVICVVISGFTGHKEATGQWIPPDINKIDIEVSCGKLELVSNALNTTYNVEGETFTLVEGEAEKEIVPGAASKIRVNVFEANTTGDVNGDGLDDTVALLTYNAGGSGTFYYVALAIQRKTGFEGTNAIFIGDRIAPQKTEIREGEIIVNYTDRYPWESFAGVQPSVWKSKYLLFENGELKEKEREFLSQEVAENLIIESWGDCKKNECSNLTVNILDGRDGVWYIQAVYEGMMDDSVQAQNRITSVHYVDGSWELGSELVKEYKCQSDRGHQDFSSELCL